MYLQRIGNSKEIQRIKIIICTKHNYDKIDSHLHSTLELSIK